MKHSMPFCRTPRCPTVFSSLTTWLSLTAVAEGNQGSKVASATCTLRPTGRRRQPADRRRGNGHDGRKDRSRTEVPEEPIFHRSPQ